MEITPLFDSKEVWGSGTYYFELKSETDSIFIDAINMEFLHVSLNRRQIDFKNSGKQLSFKAPEKIGNHELFIRYLAKPKQTVYYIGLNDGVEGNEQLWTQGQGKYTSHWLPSFDDMSEKVELDLTLNTAEGFTVIANGKLTKKNTAEGIIDWHFDMQDPMSSYLAAFAIGKFDKKELKSSSGVPIELYYEPKDSLRVESTYRYTKEIFDFLEDEIGLAYPWQNYKQVPVKDFLYAGMENTSATVFSNSYMIDSTAFIDKNYVNVNAHELAHQWFGNLVTEESSKHHWLHEGFATYYAYLAEQHLFGEDHFYWKLYETAKTLHNLSESGGGEALNNPNANSLTFYEKGAWALVMLKEKIGKNTFQKGIISYLNKHQFKNVTISDFLVEMELAANTDLSDFKSKWLENEVFPWEEVKEKLKRESESIALVFEMENEFQRIKSDDLDYESYWNRTESTNFKAHFIRQYHRVLPNAIIKRAFLSDDIKIRQALASSLYGISGVKQSTTEIADLFETLLDDKSYITIENALLKLWATFPEERTLYFSKTQNIAGLPNKNVRLLWLTLALLTPEYNQGQQQVYYNELNGYTFADNHFEVRQLAFQYLSQIQAMSDETLINLIKASDHHVWQFKKSSRNLLKELSESIELKERLLSISNSLSTEEQSTLNKLLKE
ncbi:M1 family metallopeptidase [Croceitalea marina]|uniref:Aminopeptidase N n=1 Tax=Croceitalea marina TaxID=1775166 RepID=A0ABW5MVC5_9FLAO